jgi:hypothetical protein
VSGAPHKYSQIGLVQFLLQRWLMHALTRHLNAVLLGLGSALGLCLVALQAGPRHHVARFGGAGGAPAALICPADQAVIGARVSVQDDHVMGITLSCAGDEQPGELAIETATLGVNAGQSTSLRCPPDQVAVGIWGASGTLLDQFSLSCAARAQPRAPVEHLRGVGGNGGVGFHARCSGRMRGVEGSAGEAVDHVALVCEDHDG